MTTTTLVRTSTPALLDQRISWRVSTGGRYAACTLLRPGRRPAVEVRTVTGRTLNAREVHDVPNLGPSSQLLLLEDGSVLLCHHRDGRHLVERLERDGALVPLAESEAQGFALLDERYALEYSAGTGSSHLVRYDGGSIHYVASFDGAAIGAVRLGENRIAVDVVAAGGHCSAVVANTATGLVEPFVSVSARSDDRVVGYVEPANLLVVSTDVTGMERLGIGRPGQVPVTFPDALSGAGPVTLVATSADGSTLAVAVEAGARSLLRVVDVATGRATDLPLPPLVVGGRGALTGDTLLVPVSAPDRPATLLRVDLAAGRHSFDDPPIPGPPGCRVERLPGADGVEAVVVGEPGTAPTVLLALHGGPLSAWRAQYDPLLVALATAGVAVVAPNIRGSVGYGRAHSMAIAGHWGGPDLEDVLAVGEAVTAMRPPSARRPGLLGISYGAYLAVLAAQRAPGSWSRCIALSPFVSGARLIGEGGVVADLVRRLGGATSPDLRDGMYRIAVPVLLIHGEQDDVIPVAEADLLHDRLREQGLTCTYLPLAGAGHDLLTGPHADAVLKTVTAFCHDHSAAAGERPAASRATTSTPEGREMT